MSKAIVVNEHQPRGLTDFCRWCGITYTEQPTNPCSNRLAAVPEGWEGETVEIDDATAAHLASLKHGPTLEQQRAEIDKVGPDGKRGGPANMMPCERCNTWFVPHLLVEHIANFHGGK